MLELNDLETHFRIRCPHATEACGREEPVWRGVSTEYLVAVCHCIP